MAAMLDDIKKLRPKVDVLVLSLHFGLHFIPAEIADYQIEYTHAAIDAGADLIIGHHAHILKGIEVYKGKVIFYSLGNFGFDLNLPREELEGPRFKVLMRLNPSWTIDPEYPTYPFPADSRMTGMVKCNIINDKIESVHFSPAYVNPKGQPRFVRRDEKENKQTFDYMNWLCQEEGFDTRLTYDGDDFLVSTGS
jgi:poly-gamma-glutamate synthesis protein (capsule biosynthesis protein)